MAIYLICQLENIVIMSVYVIGLHILVDFGPSGIFSEGYEVGAVRV